MKNSNPQYPIHSTQYRLSGQIFLMSILVLGAVMASALFLISIFIKDFRQSIETSESAKAFYAADSAMEWQIYCSLNDLDDLECKDAKPVMNNFTEHDYQNNFSTNGNIKTTGVSKRVSRGLEVNF
jgi:hypothetical protein